MAVKRDYYEILGVDRDASDEDIKRAFRRAAQKHHPDVDTSTGAEERFKELNEAYRVLSDRQRRAAYDMFGHAGVDGASASGEPFGGGFGPFGDIFDAFFGGSAGRRAPPAAGGRRSGPALRPDHHPGRSGERREPRDPVPGARPVLHLQRERGGAGERA